MPYFFSSCSQIGVEKVQLGVDLQKHGELIVRISHSGDIVELREGDTLKIRKGSSVSVQAWGDSGYSFALWNETDEEEDTLFFVMEEDLILSAVFEKKDFMVTIDENINGELVTDPPLASGKSYPANTEITITATADKGYIIDSLYYKVSDLWGERYFESSEEKFSFPLSSDMTIGAFFIEKSLLKDVSVQNNIVYAQPGVKALKYDLFSPSGARDLPLFIIVHGGGWTSNCEDVMRGMAREVAGTGKYVVASIDYRWIGHSDGDPVENGLEDLIGDVYGAIAHVVENAEEYGADPSTMVITGDSAGGHLSASAATMIERIGSGGFGEKEGVYEIMPSYLPKKMSAEEFKSFMLGSLKAVAPSYGVADVTERNGNMIPLMTEEGVRAVSPLYNIPEATQRSIPHFMVRGTNDPLISDETVQIYADALNDAGQDVEYIQVPDAGHAFYDWKPDTENQEVFMNIGVPCIGKMLDFFDKYI